MRYDQLYNKQDLTSVLDTARQAMLGFSPDFGRNVLDSLASSNTSYPPYNLLSLDDNHYRIEIACAGFSKDDFTIKVEKDLLSISGAKSKEIEEDDYKDKVVYHHRGISEKSFSRSFVLGKNTKVTSADFRDGILFVDVVHELPPEDEPKLIQIGG